MSEDIVELKKEILINEKKLEEEIKESKKLRLEYVRKNEIKNLYDKIN
jgi:hypothetical protein